MQGCLGLAMEVILAGPGRANPGNLLKRGHGAATAPAECECPWHIVRTFRSSWYPQVNLLSLAANAADSELVQPHGEQQD
jgi:hypothetical protein